MAAFAWLEALDVDGRVVFTSPDLCAVGDTELGRLRVALMRASFAHLMEVVLG